MQSTLLNIITVSSIWDYMASSSKRFMGAGMLQERKFMAKMISSYVATDPGIIVEAIVRSQVDELRRSYAKSSR